MSKIFQLTAQITISVYTEVKADNLKEAMDIAKYRDLMSVVDNGVDVKSDSWMCDELDGIPEGITLEAWTDEE